MFIASGYERDQIEQNTVSHIVDKSKFSQTVLIATSVLDNGVSLKDDFLENIVIMTDTREEFLQMLGRKRFKAKNNEMVNVYICVRSKEYFARRLNYINQCQQVLDSILEISMHYKEKKKRRQVNEHVFIDESSNFKLSNKNCSIQSFVWNQLDDDRISGKVVALQKIQARILDKMMHSKSFYTHVKKFLFTVEEFFYLNSLSDMQIDYLRRFYEKMNKAMETNKYAFAEEQASWLGLAVTDEMKAEYVRDTVTKRKERIIRFFEGDGQSDEDAKILGKVLSKSANLEMKEKIASDIKAILKVKDCLNDYLIASVGKSDRTLSESNFNEIMEFIEVPYRMVKPSGSTFKIVRLEDYENEIALIVEKKGKNKKIQAPTH